MKRLLLIAATLLMTASALAQSSPQSSAEIRRQLGAALEKGDKQGVTVAAMTLAEMGASLSDQSFDRIRPLLDPAIIAGSRSAWAKGSAGPVELLHQRFRNNAAPAAFGPQPQRYASVPAKYRLVEGIAYDAKTGRLFIGTVVDGQLAWHKDGKWHDVAIGSPRGGLFGMEVDPRRRLLWIAAGSVRQTAVTGERFTGLIAVNLDTLRVVRRVPVSDGQGVEGDLTIAADGTVFSSSSSGAVHRCRPGCKVLETFIAPGKFRSPQGLALAPDGRHLFIADYSTGLWLAGLDEARLTAVDLPAPAMMEGIDGLKIEPGVRPRRMIAIQNGTLPRRIIKVFVDKDGTSVRSPLVLRTIPPTAGEATLGTIDDRQTLLFVADGQWERYGPGGALKDGQPARPTPIDRLSFRDADGTVR